jgi:hypothetical protein
MVSATATHSIALFSYAFADSMTLIPQVQSTTGRELASLEVVPHPIKEFESVLSGAAAVANIQRTIWSPKWSRTGDRGRPGAGFLLGGDHVTIRDRLVIANR